MNKLPIIHSTEQKIVVQLLIIAAGHQPAADHILERFEIFGSMVQWFNGSMVQSASAQLLRLFFS